MVMFNSRILDVTIHRSVSHFGGPKLMYKVISTFEGFASPPKKTSWYRDQKICGTFPEFSRNMVHFLGVCVISMNPH